MSTAMPATEGFRVFESVPAPGPIVKFIDEIVLHAPDDMSFDFFSWRTAILGRYDVFHVHWPEFLIRDKSGWRGLVRRTLFRIFILRLKLRRTPVVRTVHNVEPHHAGGESEARLLDRLDRLVRAHVVMSTRTPVGWSGPTVLIPHGHFREPFGSLPREQKIAGRVLLFGRIHPYKGVIELIKAAEQITLPGVEIRIVGSPTAEMRVAIDRELAKPNRGGAAVSVDLRSVSDDELIAEITKSELVALPYRDAGNGNSGAGMLALSLDRPLLVPRAGLMEDLASETGEHWIHLMDQEVSGAQIEAALTMFRELPDDAHPNFVGRDWPAVAAAYADVFRQVVRESKRTGAAE